jgi:hypothetical protein
MSTLGRLFGRLALLGVAVLAFGCGSKYAPVRGTVTLEDGKPLTHGMVVFETTDGTEMARGMIQSDGSYELSTRKPGDGVKPGRYRALVSPLDMADVPDEQKTLPFDTKYTRFQTSGLEFDVTSGPNVIPIKLTRQAKRR